MELKIPDIQHELSKLYDKLSLLEPKELAENRFSTQHIIFFSYVVNGSKRVIKHYSVKKDETNKIEKFRKEYEILKFGSNHDGIIKVFGFDRMDFNYNIVGYNLIIDYLPMTLQTYLLNRGTIKRNELHSFLSQMNSILQHLHFNPEFQIVHMDIKPSNIGVKIEEGGIKYVLFDFDVSVINPSREIITSEKMKGLTPKYSAPELEAFMLNNKMGKISNKVDVYSVGIVAFEMLSGKKNFTYSNLLAEINRMPKSNIQLLLPLIQVAPNNRASQILPAKKNFKPKQLGEGIETLIPVLLILVLLILTALLYIILTI